jgi:CheY-like chemotaxis protein/HPt (histidine-containing phosphotransfer) domain-containing protein
MPSANQRSILIIDDDAISREVMQMTLEMHDYAVETAEDGQAALQLLAEGRLPATILMDTQMPGLSGVELIGALRDALRKESKARIVAISASEPGEAVRNAADGFLLKPVQVGSLAKMLASPAAQAADAEPASGPPTDAESAASAPVIDPIVFGKLKAMMPPASLREVYAATAADMKTRLALLQAAMEAANAPEVARIAHSIKGACAMVGLTRARETAARLEISNLPVTWPAELAQLHIALRGLEGMLADDFSA